MTTDVLLVHPDNHSGTSWRLDQVLPPQEGLSKDRLPPPAHRCLSLTVFILRGSLACFLLSPLPDVKPQERRTLALWVTYIPRSSNSSWH